ncbi:mitogen-activated protein kinase kinase [Plasmodiophora brassicae]|uniref:mitogen-activated protein kinase kinase n=1 Tax=Plasmodiophora brassicae TaxID=37360 RepID=A0A2L2BM90_PLABS|nr:MAPKK2 [Plasmodiophora brassicae]
MGSRRDPKPRLELDVEDKPVDHSYEMTTTALRTHGYEIGVNGISLRPPLSVQTDRPADDGGALSSSMFVRIGTLGKGSTSSVSKAFRVDTCEMFALKSVAVHVKSQRHQLVKELDAYNSVACNFIAKFHGAYYCDGTTVIVLEYMNRGSLQDAVNNVGPLPEHVLQRIAKQVVLGLRHIHSLRKVHRDIKPGNILLNSAGVAKVADFGIAKELDLGNMAAQTYVGTQLYMSPERIHSEPYGCPADIWSFGLSLATCATGRFPYPGANGFLPFYESMTRGPPPTLPRSRFSVGLRNFISKCLVKDPAKRWSAERLLSHPWIADVDVTEPMRWPWDTTGSELSPSDEDDLSTVARILREQHEPLPIVPDRLERLAASLNLPVHIVQRKLDQYMR